jgi:hypothetical protein
VWFQNCKIRHEIDQAIIYIFILLFIFLYQTNVYDLQFQILDQQLQFGYSLHSEQLEVSAELEAIEQDLISEMK